MKGPYTYKKCDNIEGGHHKIEELRAYKG